MKNYMSCYHIFINCVYKLNTCLLESKIRGTSCIFSLSGIERSSWCVFMECYYLVTFTLVMCIEMFEVP